MSTPAAFVSSDQVVATFHSLMEGADHIDRAFVNEWIYLGLLEIGATTAWYGEATLYPTEFAMRKPEDLHSVIDIALYDNGTPPNELRFAYRGKGTRIHASDNSLINDGTYAPELGAPIDLSEDQYYFHIGSNGINVAFAQLKYWRLPTDINGNLLIPESDVFPLALFCRYCYYMRKDDKYGIALAKPIWIAARNEVRGLHKTPSMLEGSELARSWNTMIKKMRFRKF